MKTYVADTNGSSDQSTSYCGCSNSANAYRFLPEPYSGRGGWYSLMVVPRWTSQPGISTTHQSMPYCNNGALSMPNGYKSTKNSVYFLFLLHCQCTRDGGLDRPQMSTSLPRSGWQSDRSSYSIWKKKIKSTAENFNFPIAINQRSLSTKCVSRYLQISWRREWQDLRNYIIPMIGQFHCAIVIGRFRIFPFTPIIDFRWTNPIIAHCVH